MPRRWLCAGIAGALLLLCLPLAGHPGDPKAMNRVAPYRGHGFLTGGTTGSGSAPAIGFPASGVQLLSWLSIPDFGPQYTSANDCWGYVSPSGREYALIGLSGGTSFVEVTNPGNPVIVQTISGPDSLWRDVKVYGHYAYAVSEGGDGIQVIDMDQIDQGTVSLVTNVVTGGTTATHNVVINDASATLYRCGGGSNGLRIYSLANPASPQFISSWSDRYVHDAEIVNYTTGPYAGQEIAFCCSGFNGGWTEPGLDILDVTDKQNIVLLSRYQYPGAQYSHQAWLSDDRHYLYLNDELDEENLGIPTTTKVIDVSDLSNPFVAASFDNGNTSIGHNLYIVGNTIFEANYRSGLRVFDATDPLAPVEIASFDTWPSDDNAAFNGLWSNYPYLPSGIIIGSDIEKGLFVWRLGDPPLAFSYPGGLPDLIDPTGGSFSVQITEQGGATLDPATASLFYDDGGGYQQTALLPLGGGLFQAEIPSSPCGHSVSYYLSAATTGGESVTDPPFAPGNAHDVLAALDELVLVSDGMETDSGWTVGDPADTATAGIWERVDPNGTDAQPEDDHTPDPGVACWVTGQGTPGGSVGENDVDGGQTTLTSPIYDLSASPDARIGYWRWYSNNAGAAPNQDVLTIDISNDGGASWVPVEVVGPGGIEVSGGWYHHEFRVADLIAPTAQMRLRFIANDADPGSIIEAAIDDLEISDVLCGDCNGNGIADLTDIASGTSQDCNQNDIPDECDIAQGSSLDANGNGIPDECDCAAPFVRGEMNGDGNVNIADAIYDLSYLFTSGPAPTPLPAGDINADGSIDISDPIALVNYLFGSGPPPAPPFPNAGCP